MSKQVETSKEPIKDTQTIKEPITDDTHIVDRCRYLQDVPTNMDPVLTGVGIIGQRGSLTISRCVSDEIGRASYHQISPARERYYDIMVDHIEEKNDVNIDKEELRKAISHVQSEDESEHELNIDNMIQ